MIRFLRILSRQEAAKFSPLAAAELLGVGERTFGRWRQRFEGDGEAGPFARRLGKASGERVPVDRETEAYPLYRIRCADFTAKHFHERLSRDLGFSWGYAWIMTFLHSRGLLNPPKRRGARRRKRPQPLRQPDWRSRRAS